MRRAHRLVRRYPAPPPCQISPTTMIWVSYANQFLGPVCGVHDNDAVRAVLKWLWLTAVWLTLDVIEGQPSTRI